MIFALLITGFIGKSFILENIKYTSIQTSNFEKQINLLTKSSFSKIENFSESLFTSKQNIFSRAELATISNKETLEYTTNSFKRYGQWVSSLPNKGYVFLKNQALFLVEGTKDISGFSFNVLKEVPQRTIFLIKNIGSDIFESYAIANNFTEKKISDIAEGVKSSVFVIKNSTERTYIVVNDFIEQKFSNFAQDIKFSISSTKKQALNIKTDYIVFNKITKKQMINFSGRIYSIQEKGKLFTKDIGEGLTNGYFNVNNFVEQKLIVFGSGIKNTYFGANEFIEEKISQNYVGLKLTFKKGTEKMKTILSFQKPNLKIGQNINQGFSGINNSINKGTQGIKNGVKNIVIGIDNGFNQRLSLVFSSSNNIVQEIVKSYDFANNFIEEKISTFGSRILTFGGRTSESLFEGLIGVKDGISGIKSKFSILIKSIDSGLKREIVKKPLIPKTTEQGLVVIPSTGQDEEIKKKIKESFSDEVKVEIKDETSGIITPVFKERKGDDYLYILVPLKY